jgi:NitT/TauT family transport system permease protein
VRRLSRPLFSAIGIALIAGIWGLLSLKYSGLGIVPSPRDTFAYIGAEAQTAAFWETVAATLRHGFVSFFISFAAASALAALSHLRGGIKRVLGPLIVVCRAIPTAAVILILLLCVNSRYIPVAVAFLVVFPLCYEHLFHALEAVDKQLLEMAVVFKIPLSKRLLGIYLPGITPAAFSSIRAGFGLNIKVVIAAEILGLPSVSIGYAILSAKQGFAFAAAFAWLVVAVLLCFVCELAISAVERLCIPYRYGARRTLARLLKRLTGMQSMKSWKEAR